MLRDKTVAILATHGFEEVELLSPKEALEEAGATCTVVSIERGQIRGFHEFEPASSIEATRAAAEASADEYDALMLPGGTINGDKLRADPDVQRFVAGFFAAGKPVAAICHAPWLLINAGVAEGRYLTSFPSIRMDLENAGAKWRDAEVVRDGNLLTSRGPDDLPAFNAAMIEAFA